MYATKDTAWDNEISRKLSDGRKITGCMKMRMLEILADNRDCPTSLLREHKSRKQRGPFP